MKRALSLLPLIGATLLAADDHSVPTAINALGLDLYRAQTKSAKGNLLLSPYSIQNALAMTYAGADGATREEMQRVLHFPADEEAVHTGFGAITRALNAAMEQSKGRVAAASERGGPSTPIEINVANRLFGQSGFEFKAPFLATLKDRYEAPLEMVDFSNAPEQSRSVINEWVAKATKEKIRDIIPPGALDADTRLALANAIYFRAGWAREFSKTATKPEPFLVGGKEKVDVPTMLKHGQLGYKKGDAFTGVTVGYEGDQLQLLVILPDEPTGLGEVVKAVTPQVLEECARLQNADVILHLPKFKFEPPPMALSAALRALGMKTAFDDPRGSANFNRMAPRKDDEYLRISEVFHKTWLALDEQGTEAAAATAVRIPRAPAARVQRQTPPPPIIVKVDRPFLFAIQHVPSATCLFLGRVIDPR